MTMRPNSRRSARTALAGFAALAAGFSAEAQEALRSSQAYQQASQARTRLADDNGYGNTRGALSYTLGAGLSLEYNDNVNLSDANSEDDLIIAPSVSAGARWELTKYNSLGLDLSFSYLAYMNNPDFSRVEFGLSPTSDNNIGFSFLIKDVRVDIYDSFGVRSDAFRDASVSSQSKVTEFRNTLGTTAAYEWSNAQIRGGYSLQKSFFLDSQFEDNDRLAHLLDAGFQYAVGPALYLGIEASASLSAYTSDKLNDSTVITVGPSVSWKVSEFFRFSLGGGPSFSTYSANNLGFKPASRTSYYLYASADHQLTESIKHTLGVNRGVSPGIDSFASETLSINYRVNWRLIRNVSLSAGVFYDTGTASSGAATLVEQDFDRIGGSIDAGYSFNSHLTAGIGYRYTTRTSSTPGSDYTQNQATFSVSYKF